MISGVFALCMVVMLAFPETPTARWLRALMVERPVAWFSEIKRRDVILLFVMFVLTLAAGEFVAVFGAAELFALGANISLFIDAVLVTAAVTIATAAATAWRSTRALVSQVLGGAVARIRVRTFRRSKTRKTRQPNSLDDEGPAWALAHAV